MPKTLADARTKLTALTGAPANLAAVTAVVANGGTDLQCRINAADYRLSATGSDTVADSELCADGNAVTFGRSNYEGSVTPFRYLTAAGAADGANDIAWDLLQDKGTTLWLLEREGPLHDTPWAAGDVYELYEVITDNPQKPTDRAGFIKRIVPLGVQRRVIGTIV